MRIINVYTDGSGNWKNRFGGAGVAFFSGSKCFREISKSYSDTTTNRMELQAMILALRALKPSKINSKNRVYIYSDSEYVVRGINVYLDKWITNQFFNIANQDLWLDLYERYIQFNSAYLKINWVKGHAGNAGNELADQLAKKAYLSMKNSAIQVDMYVKGNAKDTYGGIGILIYKNNELFKEHSESFTHISVDDYSADLAAITSAIEMINVQSVKASNKFTIYTDCETAIKIFNHELTNFAKKDFAKVPLSKYWKRIYKIYSQVDLKFVKVTRVRSDADLKINSDAHNLAIVARRKLSFSVRKTNLKK